MDPETIRWLLSTLIIIEGGALTFLATSLMRHLEHCREVQKQLGALSTLPEEIKTLRKHVHDIRNHQLKTSE